MSYLNIYIADDHNIVAQGISKLLEKINEVKSIEIFSNGKELLEACILKVPDIIFLDLQMPILDGKNTLIHLNKDFPNCKCFILSMNNEKFIIDDCIKNGASGYLNKDCSLDELLEAITTNEIPYFSKDVLKILSGYKQSNYQIIEFEPLSNREKDVLKLLCDGMSPKEIAKNLYLSNRTIETHKTNIMQKFHVNSIGKLISIAIKNNLV